MSIREGKISMELEFGIIDKMSQDKKNNGQDAAKDYRSLQGYTAGSGDSQLFVMRKARSQDDNAGEDSHAKLVEVSYSNTVPHVSSDKTKLHHGNDCTYYKDHYYVVTANDAVVYEFNKYSLEKTGEYSCEGLNFNTITCIAHISGAYFLLGKGRKVAICKKTDHKFVAQTHFLLDGDANDGEPTTINGKTNLVRQGMCVQDDRLYKVYGKRKSDGLITTNYVAKWELDGDAPRYNGCTLKGMYEHVSSDHFLFEMEDISANDYGMYVAVKEEKNGTGDNFSAKLYSITF